jgi:two-component system, chemotaxis family, response regulator Rcp1
METITAPKKALKVLLVEDNRGDIVLMQKSLRECRVPVDLQVVQDGEAALMALRESIGFPGKEDPDLVLLDLGLPKIDGQQVLQAIKGNPGLKHIPVFVVSSSNSDQDIASAFQHQANLYFVKPMEIGQFDILIKKIEDFWLKDIHSTD